MFEPTQAVNSNVQGPAGDIMSCAFVKLTTALPPEARIILQVHDSVVVECPEGMADSVLKVMVDTMTTDLTIGEHSCLFTVDAKVGRSWDVV
jgi:DNA polymerase-1